MAEIFSAKLWARILDVLDTSRLANPNINSLRLLAAKTRGLVPPVSHLLTLLWAPLLPAVGPSPFAVSRLPSQDPQFFSCEATICNPTRVDPTALHDPDPTVNILPASRIFATRATQCFRPLPCELPSSRDRRSLMTSMTLCPLA
jgi:hypothetical protein